MLGVLSLYTSMTAHLEKRPKRHLFSDTIAHTIVWLMNARKCLMFRYCHLFLKDFYPVFNTSTQNDIYCIVKICGCAFMWPNSIRNERSILANSLPMMLALSLYCQSRFTIALAKNQNWMSSTKHGRINMVIG